MKLKITSKVDHHHTNPRYKCLVVEWNGDLNFRCRGNGVHDWLPTDEEIVEIAAKLSEVSPTFWPKLVEKVKPATYVHDFV
jgi:hypothetical protein